MREEAMQNGNRLFVHCDFFRDKVMLAMAEPSEAKLDDEEQEGINNHKKECRTCILWLIEKFEGDNLHPALSRKRGKHVGALRANLARLERKQKSRN